MPIFSKLIFFLLLAILFFVSEFYGAFDYHIDGVFFQIRGFSLYMLHS